MTQNPPHRVWMQLACLVHKPTKNGVPACFCGPGRKNYEKQTAGETLPEAQTSTNFSPSAFSALIDCTSKWTLPATPSPQSSIIWMFASFLAVRQTSASSAHSTLCSPVAEDHLSLKEENGILTSTKSSPAGTENLSLKQPRLKGKDPPAEQE